MAKHGRAADSDLIARRLGALAEIAAAAPAYLNRHGVLESPDDLDGHVVVGFLSSQTGAALGLEFVTSGRMIVKHLPAAVLATGAETMVDLARLGLGLIQVPRYRLAADLALGRLVEILPATPPAPSPVSVLYPQDRQVSPRVRAFLDRLAGIDFEH